jgi:KaiC/GvpD/RAD55 family RecA-like ATPase
MNGGSITALMNLKRRKILTQHVFQAFFDRFGEHDLVSSDVYQAYKHLKDTYKKKAVMEKLATVDLEKETIENLYDIFTEQTKLLETESDENIETFKDVLPRSNEPQKSLITFWHDGMKNNLAIDSNYVVVIGARPHSGKTTFAVKICMDNAINSKCLYISCEMTKEQIVRKSKYYKLGHNNVDIIYKSSIALSEITRIVRKTKPKFVVIDQLKKVVATGNSEYERFTYVANQLKMLAVQLDTPIICLAQINRSAEEGKRPMLHHLKGSGSLEEEADVVMILDVIPDEIDKKLFTRIYIDKNRSLNGQLGYYDFDFDKETNKYKEKIF